jgi:hypothetical protein
MLAEVAKVSTKRYMSSGSYRLEPEEMAASTTGAFVSEQLAAELRDAAADEILAGKTKADLARQMGYAKVQGLDAFLKGDARLSIAMAIRLFYALEWDAFECKELLPFVAPRGVVYPALEATLEYLDNSVWSPAAILLARGGFLGGDPGKELLGSGTSPMAIWTMRLDLATALIEPLLQEVKKRIPV